MLGSTRRASQSQGTYFVAFQKRGTFKELPSLPDCEEQVAPNMLLAAATRPRPPWLVPPRASPPRRGGRRTSITSWEAVTGEMPKSHCDLGDSREAVGVDLACVNAWPRPRTNFEGNFVDEAAQDICVYFQKRGPGAFGNICAYGSVVDKCLAYRSLCELSEEPGSMLFNDARTLGKPICSRLLPSRILEDIASAIEFSMPNYEIRFQGCTCWGRSEHCGSATLWVVLDPSYGRPSHSYTVRGTCRISAPCCCQFA